MPAAANAAQSTAALIVESRKLFVADGTSCDAWEVEVPNLLEETRGRLRHAGVGEPSVIIDFERQGDDLMLEAPCFGDKKALCLTCELLMKPATDTALRAYARKDECEEARPVAAGLRGCAAAVAASSREHVRKMLDGSLRDDFIARVAAARVVSRGSGAECIPYQVRKSGKQLFLDWELSEYPEEVTSRAAGVVSIDEVPERNPHYKPRGPGAIGMGCCAGSAYHVLGLGDGVATLRKIPRSKGETASVVEFRMAGCSR